jgi:endonuclease/exonuclease/phosphatase family metal-dependent hydrolase
MTTPTTFDVTSRPTAGAGTDHRLTGWRENVGRPVAVARPAGAGATAAAKAGVSDTPTPTLAVLSWNVWIGRGRLIELVERIREGAYAAAGVTPDMPLVVLAQEAYRSDDSIPARSNGWAPREIASRMRPQEDIVDLAGRLGLSLRYAPSMRNGAGRSDRGNAILSSLPLHDTRAVELPHVFQRRVIVTATVTLGGRPLRLVSAHLDPRGPPDHRWLGAAGRARQAAYLVDAVTDDTVVLGADLNLARGRREGAWRLLAEAAFTFGTPPTLPAWRHTYHALPRLVLDYLLIRNRRGAIASATVHRLDEDPRDRGTTVFGSDHHPLLARIELQ